MFFRCFVEFWEFYYDNVGSSIVCVVFVVCDLIGWVNFMCEMVDSFRGVSLSSLEAYVYGAYFILFDGFGLGFGMFEEVVR